MRVLMFVSNAFVSDPRVYAEGASLVKAGFEVVVIAWDRERQNPPIQNWSGIHVIRLVTRLLPRRYRFGSALWVGFNLLLWQRQAYRVALALDREKRFDVVHCHDLDTLNIGIRLKRRLKVPLIHDAHEIYGYMMTRTFPHWIAGLFLRLEKRLVRSIDRLITVSEALKRYFETITDKPISVVMNCKPLQSSEYKPSHNESFTLLYIGSLHQGRALPMLVRAAKDLVGVRCLIGGIGHADYIEDLSEECSRTSNVKFLGRVPFDEVIPMTMKADCVFFMANPDDLNNRIALANKQFEAMVCGRPIICTQGTYSGEVTEQEEVGLVVEHSEQALRETIIKLRDDPELRQKLGRNALRAAITKYNWQKQEEELLELYKSLQKPDV